MADRLCVMVLFGGRSGEHEVSLNSARSVLSVLDLQKYDVVQVGISHDGAWFSGENVIDALAAGTTSGLIPVTFLPFPGDNHLYALRQAGETRQLEAIAKVDVVFPVLHGTFGEDGTLQGMLELTDLAYVGAGVLGSAVGMDKGLFKELMRAQHIPVLDDHLFTRQEVQEDTQKVVAIAEQLASYPLFTKPANLGSSVGITKCRTRSDLVEGLLDAARYDRRVLVERGLEHPREIEVSVLGNENPVASIPGEIVPADDFYSYNAKYIDDRSKLLIPAPLSAGIVLQAQELAIRVYTAIDCAGLARVDFLLDTQANSLYVSEINTIPGFTQISMYPKLWAASGISYAELVDRLIELALARKKDRATTERRYGGSA